ncbi:U-box domain-containing protein 15-like, partial [Asparagus officinalis]
MTEDSESLDQCLAHARSLILSAIKNSKSTKSFVGRWTLIVSKLEQIPNCLSDLSSHPLFAKNGLCKEQIQSISTALSETIALAEQCSCREITVGKLQMQSNLDSLSAKLDLCIKDCHLLIKTGVLGELNVQSLKICSVPELLARVQIGNSEAKHKAVDGLLESLRNDEKNVIVFLSQSNINALVQLLTATAPKIREKAVTIICMLAESGSCEGLLISEGVIAPLVKLMDSGSLTGREKAVVTLQRLSMSVDNARLISEHGGILPLIEISQAGDSISQLAAVGTLKNLSILPEIGQNLVDEGIIRVMINLLDSGTVLGLKEYAAECLQNLTSLSGNIKKIVVSEGGIKSILGYLDGPLPQESAVGALRNLISTVSTESTISLGILPRIVHVLKNGSPGAKQAAASAICKISNSTEMKSLICEYECLPLLVNLLEAKLSLAREVAAQAIASLISCRHSRKEVKKDERSVPNLVQLLDPSPQNTAKKYAVCCLLLLVSSKKCKRIMISYGAIGYLKKLCEMDVQGAKKLLDRL